MGQFPSYSRRLLCKTRLINGPNINSIREWPDNALASREIIITFTMMMMMIIMMMMMIMIVSLSFFTVFTANAKGSMSRLWKGNRRRTAQIFRRIQNF